MLWYILLLKRRHSLFSINISQKARFFNSLFFLSSILVKNKNFVFLEKYILKTLP